MATINLEKQFRFALASALTKTAKAGQAATIGAIKGAFTIRNNWLTSPIGPKVLPATKADLSAAVVLKKDFLNLHEDGGIKLPSGKYLAIPTANVRRNKRDIITRANRPAQLKNTFIVTGKSGRKVVMQRVGKGKRRKVRALYILVPQVKIDERPTVTTPVLKTFEKQFSNTLFRELKNALATAKS